jgi:hypothetical protein
MSATDAKKCFNENLRLFANPPEKWNLYSGLSNLASAMEDVERRLDQLTQVVRAQSRH